MARSSVAVLALSAGAPPVAWAGPPFETDDPAPTSIRHWEVYAFTDAGGRGAEFDGSSGVDINYGMLPGVQFTVTLPLDISSGDGPAVAMGDVDISAKYRFWSQWNGGGSAALAAIVTVPVRSAGPIADRVGIRLPLWLGWEGNRWTVYGGGGPALSGEVDGRDSLFVGVVVAHKFGAYNQIGAEFTWHGPEHVGERPETGVGIGCIIPFTPALALNAAAGPRFVAGETPRYRFYLGLAAQF